MAPDLRLVFPSELNVVSSAPPGCSRAAAKSAFLIDIGLSLLVTQPAGSTIKRASPRLSVDRPAPRASAAGFLACRR